MGFFARLGILTPAIALIAGLAAAPASAEEGFWTNGVSSLGELKYKPGFSRFDYVNPDAPKRGVLRMSEFGVFDSLNPIPNKGNLALPAAALVYETLMKPSLDEPLSTYGLIAESVSYPEDYSSVSYRLHPKAAWADGKPITVEDVIFSFDKVKEFDPAKAFYYQHVIKAEKTGEREVKFTFDEKNNRDLVATVGQLTIVPKHWWEGTDARGVKRNVAATTLEPVMGSGPYKLVAISPGSTLTFELRDDYWGKDLPVNIGYNNFKRIEYTYYADIDVEFEAFRSGDSDFWAENEAKRWATAYDFPAVQQGKVKKEELPNDYRSSGVMVGFIPNLRREQFQDARVREALNYAFDFETLKRTIFYGQYSRINSYFFGSELASSGLPQGKELDLLTALKDKVPPSVFTTPYSNPVAGDEGKLRQNLRKALGLFKEAGWELKGGRMVNARTGKPFQFEILLSSNIIERVALPFATNLKKIGVTATVRSVDASQFTERWRKRDFDVMYQGWAQSLNPGSEQAEYWGSKAAAAEGTQNYAGIANPAIDALIRKIIFAPDRDNQVAAVKALDRILLHNHYIVPSYTLRTSRIAYWDKFERPEELPHYSSGFPSIWWAKGR
ncbi:extracellular solute-binding protein [Rhizobium sp. TRM95796]|uniref:extracellular solute-binding protein n=1 Tax=Rhizobium sp. TRM95796 TaxID=2979862 RepID=UPI0021E885AF|nr:extracellular solute-binding protein [Rhizobium sp. TRM95796]MCV3766998.1 extracellular solute-binding protein [Rhizobium sp. TRM95796]